MACFTVSLVVSGPGVKRIFFWVMAQVPSRYRENQSAETKCCRDGFLSVSPKLIMKRGTAAKSFTEAILPELPTRFCSPSKLVLKIHPS